MAYDSFDVLYEDWSPIVYWTAYGISHHHEAAMDVTQTVFLQAFRHWDTLCALEPQQVKAWIWRTARNTGLDQLKKNRREVLVFEPPENKDHSDTPEEAVIRRERADRIWQAVEELPAHYREAIVLHYFAHLTQQEAAKALGVTGGTYRSRLARGRAMLEKGGLLDGSI